jgi:pimeloyl-ACP methyl ester carboxylesterase
MATKKRQPADAPARLRRMYIDCRYGQLHLATAYPASGGFDEASPILFLHGEDGTGADFNRCAALLGTDRSIYAPDLPGNGGSDAPKGRLPVAGMALAVIDLIDNLRLKRVDLVGCGRGALIAFELATTRPQEVRRLVIAGTQQPATGIPQPMLQLSPDPARVLIEPADAVVAEIRSFLDRV